MRKNSNLEKFEETIFLAKEKFFSSDELAKFIFCITIYFSVSFPLNP